MTLPKFPRSTGGRPSFHVDWLRSGVSLSIYIALAYLVQQVDFLVVGTRSTAVEAGLYSVANRLATTLQLVLAPVQQVLISRFARHWSFGETRAASFTARRIGLFGLAGCLPLLLAFLFFGHLVLSIFGPAYGGAAGPLAILTLAQILPLLLGPGLMVLSMIHETRIAVAILAMAVLFDLGLAWFLLPSLGLLGAAVARVVALAIIAIAPYVWLRRRTLLRIAVWDRPSPAEPTRA
jgi:O-antigen/teichoic acid export membrane protein